MIKKYKGWILFVTFLCSLAAAYSVMVHASLAQILVLVVTIVAGVYLAYKGYEPFKKQDLLTREEVEQTNEDCS